MEDYLLEIFLPSPKHIVKLEYSITQQILVVLFPEEAHYRNLQNLQSERCIMKCNQKNKENV